MYFTVAFKTNYHAVFFRVPPASAPGLLMVQLDIFRRQVKVAHLASPVCVLPKSGLKLGVGVTFEGYSFLFWYFHNPSLQN